MNCSIFSGFNEYLLRWCYSNEVLNVRYSMNRTNTFMLGTVEKNSKLIYFLLIAATAWSMQNHEFSFLKFCSRPNSSWDIAFLVSFIFLIWWSPTWSDFCDRAAGWLGCSALLRIEQFLNKYFCNSLRDPSISMCDTSFYLLNFNAIRKNKLIGVL